MGVLGGLQKPDIQVSFRVSKTELIRTVPRFDNHTLSFQMLFSGYPKSQQKLIDLFFKTLKKHQHRNN